MSTDKIRIIHYSNSLNIGGTERTLELFATQLNPDRYEVFVVCCALQVSAFLKLKTHILAGIGFRQAKSRLDLWKNWLARKPGLVSRLGQDRVRVAQDLSDLVKILAELRPHILHVHTSGRSEPPVDQSEIMNGIPHVVATQVFEFQNTNPLSKKVKKFFFVSRWLLENAAVWAVNDPRSRVMYNPTERPLTQKTLRSEFGIESHVFVVGRVGRADPSIHDPISLRAFARAFPAQGSIEARFLALSPPPNFMKTARELGVLDRIIVVEPTADADRISSFYNTIDVLAHARRDGETFGCNIAEAMIHGKPVISHRSGISDAQVEVIGEGGVVVGQGDFEAYADALLKFALDRELRDLVGQRAKDIAMKRYELKVIVRQLEMEYESLIQSELSSRSL